MFLWSSDGEAETERGSVNWSKLVLPVGKDSGTSSARVCGPGSRSALSVPSLSLSWDSAPLLQHHSSLLLSDVLTCPSLSTLRVLFLPPTSRAGVAKGRIPFKVKLVYLTSMATFR